MKILEVKNLALPGVKVIRFGRFADQRGYFAETFRQSDVQENSELDFLKPFTFVQTNESFARSGVVKGLHFQWQPPLGKLLRTVQGRMVDMILDIRKSSPAFGKIILYDLPSNSLQDYNEWIWLPPGVAHGNFFLQDSLIEYFFTANYNSKAEAGISPLADDLDWSACDPVLKREFEKLGREKILISDKDKSAMSLSAWKNDLRSENFT